MTTAQIAQHFNAKKVGRGKYMALCSAHPDRNRSLGITEGKKGVMLRCWSAGCSVQDIVKAAGLTMGQLFYDEGRKVDPRAMAEARRKREADELRARDIRIGEWCVRFILRGYTLAERDADWRSVCACALVLSNKPIPHWERIMQTHLERLEAADYCATHKMLPPNARLEWVII